MIPEQCVIWSAPPSDFILQAVPKSRHRAKETSVVRVYTLCDGMPYGPTKATQQGLMQGSYSLSQSSARSFSRCRDSSGPPQILKPAVLHTSAVRWADFGLKAERAEAGTIQGTGTRSPHQSSAQSWKLTAQGHAVRPIATHARAIRAAHHVRPCVHRCTRSGAYRGQRQPGAWGTCVATRLHRGLHPRATD